MKQSLQHSLGAGRVAKIGNTRTAGKEQYYTPLETAQKLTQKMFEIIPNIEKFDFIEPAAGTGSFIKALIHNGVNESRIKSFDIEPKYPTTNKTDFLEAITINKNQQTKTICITNPPFGRNNSLSIPFFNKAAESCDYICFVVPRSWRKWSVQNRLNMNFHLIHDEELILNYVDENGIKISKRKQYLHTVFQIWEKRDYLREKVQVVDPGLVTKVQHPSEADVSLRIFGRGCGEVFTELEPSKNLTKMYLKLNHPRALEALRGANFKQFYENVAFVEALGLMEINYALAEWCSKHNVDLKLDKNYSNKNHDTHDTFE